jgi:YD repeat-containing protein
MEMRTHCVWFAAASLIAVACSGDLDCRHKSRECAEGFVCAQEGAGDWQCVPQKASAGATTEADSGKRIDEGKNVPPPPQSPAPAPAPVLCMDHPMCAGKAAKCFCGPNGNLLTRFLYDGEAGKPREKATYASDDEGRIVVDEGMDGTADSQHSYKYNGRGDPIAWQINRLTKSGDAKDQLVTYIYDAQGRLTQQETDIDINGSVDSTCRYSPPCPPPIPNASCTPVCD